MTRNTTVVTRTVEGTLRTATGSLPGALIEVFRIAKRELPDPPEHSNKRKAACLSDSKGAFRFPGLKPGLYELRISARHWETWRLQVEIDRKVRAEPIELEIAPPL